MDEQPEPSKCFYLRRHNTGEIITNYPVEAAAIHSIDKSSLSISTTFDPLERHPIAFLVRLYQATGNNKYLESATAYADFCLSCHESIFACEFSHKLAWALAELNAISPKQDYMNAIEKICRYFISQQQDDGLWFSTEPLKAYDQSAEIICWFFEIKQHLLKINSES